MHKKPADLPEVIELTEAQVDEIINHLQQSSLDSDTKAICIKSIELALWFPDVLQRKNISIHRLRRLVFGAGYKPIRPTKDKLTDDKQNSDENNDNHNSDETSTTKISKVPSTSNDSTTDEKPVNADKPTKKPGHGRMPYTVYADCEELINLTVEELKPGDPCPQNCSGRLTKHGAGNIIRVKGQNFARVLHYVVEKYRCALCGYVVSAALPPDIGDEKYDTSFKSILVLQKYYAGVPFYRQENFQALLNFPLPDATQWDLIEKVAQCCYAVFHALKELAANGRLIHNDDTTLKILEHIKKIKEEVYERVGMFTTGIFADYEGHQIALFLNGTQHAGENLNDVLALRAEDKDDIVQMCDGLSHNIPKTFKTIVCNCLSHGFRKFEELKDYYPDECIEIMHYISQLYDVDEKTVDMSSQTRLEYHQEHSQPIADTLLAYMSGLLTQRLVEPNSDLGKAIEYMQKRWDKLTRFLAVAGAPLDNNIIERALKLPIRTRKNSLFYRSRYSAQIGGMLTSLIYTCQLAGANPYHYLTMLQDYCQHITPAPKQWLPWNYQSTLAQLEAT